MYKTLSAPLVVQVEISEKCPNRCLHCYNFWRRNDKKTKLVNMSLEKIDRVVVGLPLNMEGKETEMTKEVKLFVEKLRGHLNIPVQTFDERLTSQMADTLLRKVKGEKKQDQVAAQIILQNYLEQQKQID